MTAAKPQPRLYTSHNIDWEYVPEQASVMLRCTDCGAHVQRPWADEHSTAPQRWADQHVCPGYCQHILVPSQYPNPCEDCQLDALALPSDITWLRSTQMPDVFLVSCTRCDAISPQVSPRLIQRWADRHICLPDTPLKVWIS